MQANIFSFMLVPEKDLMKAIKKEKLSTKVVSPSGVIITLEDMKDWDKDKHNSISETR